jgi:hypothetical protein
MAATVLIREKNTVSETATDKTSGTIRFKNADNATVDLNNPMVVPGAGSDWSFEKWVRVNLGGTFTQITNIKAYTDGGNGMGTGVSVWWKGVATFATPVEGTSSAGYTNGFTYTSGAPLTLGAGPYTATGDAGNYLVMLCEVASTASQGITPTETITCAWDEV